MADRQAMSVLDGSVRAVTRRTSFWGRQQSRPRHWHPAGATLNMRQKLPPPTLLISLIKPTYSIASTTV